eukprot:g29433.t1
MTGVLTEAYKILTILKCRAIVGYGPSAALHSSLEHLDNKDVYVRLLCINYSSAFNTIIPSRLISKIPRPSKTKELIIDLRKKGGEHILIYINGVEVERAGSIKFLGVVITNNLSWTSHVDVTVKKAQCLFVLRWLRKFGMSIRSLINLYTCNIESILSGYITAWYGNCSAQD